MGKNKKTIPKVEKLCKEASCKMRQRDFKIYSVFQKSMCATSDITLILIDKLILGLLLSWLQEILSSIYDAPVTSQETAMTQRCLPSSDKDSRDTLPPLSFWHKAPWVIWLSLAHHACAMEQNSTWTCRYIDAKMKVSVEELLNKDTSQGTS